MTSLLDRLYARFSNRLLFFKDGWGDLARLRELRQAGVRTAAPRFLTVRWEETEEAGTAVLRRGRFTSPYEDLPLPAESREAYLELVPVCLHFAATGDEGFSRRRLALALPLLASGIGSLILENPYYGRRRPPDQHRKMLNRFSDLWAMGGAAVAEGRGLLAWLRQEGHTRLGVCGISMGGSMAAQVAALEPGPVAMVGCVTAHSASAVFTEGILSRYLAWDTLEGQLDGQGGAVALMRELLAITDIRGLPPLKCPSAAFLVAAADDAYVPSASARLLHDHWPGSTLRWLRGGHVGAFLFHRPAFLVAIRDAFAALDPERNLQQCPP
jgi:pimeloyl-ACP methyl ester carboxylesterase